MNEETLRVRELIEKLQQFDPDQYVNVDGGGDDGPDEVVDVIQGVNPRAVWLVTQ